MSEKKETKKKKNRTGAIFMGVVLVIIFVLLCMSLRKVSPGYVGVVYSMNGGVQEGTLSQGWHLIKPGQKLTSYSIGIEQSYLTATKDGDSPDDDSFSAPSKDGKGLQMELTFTYRFDEARVTSIFNQQKARSGKEVLTVFIKPNVISWTKEVTSQYPVAEILGDKRGELNAAVQKYLAEKFEPYGIIIENASLINITTDDETKVAIDRKVNAQQELELANIEAQTAQVNAEKEKQVALIAAEQEKETALIEAEKNKEVASVNAEKTLITAQAEADAAKIKAEAEAAANAMIAQSLTPELIQKIKYESWNGELPQYQAGDGSSAIIDMR